MIADGRVAVVTGGGSGIGEAVAGLLAAAGARVWIADIDDGAAARVAGQVTEAGGVVYGRRVDVAHAESVQVFADEIIASDGRIDVLVNSAGVAEWSRFEDTSNTQWDRMLAVNLTGVFNACRLLGAPMIGQRSGKIINVASTLGIFGPPIWSPTQRPNTASLASLGPWPWNGRNTTFKSIAYALEPPGRRVGSPPVPSIRVIGRVEYPSAESRPRPIKLGRFSSSPLVSRTT